MESTPELSDNATFDWLMLSFNVLEMIFSIFNKRFSEEFFSRKSFQFSFGRGDSSLGLDRKVRICFISLGIICDIVILRHALFL